MLRRLVGDHLTFDVATTRPLPLVVADRSQMEQVVMNLVLNARDATPPGGRITIRTGTRMIAEAEAERERLDQAGEYVWVSVEDTGCGMSSEVMARAFEPFFTTKPKGSGTGLGLATAYGSVAQSGGFMRVRQRAGRRHDDDRAPAAFRVGVARSPGLARSDRRRRRHRARAGGRGRTGGPPLRRRRAVPIRLPDHRRRDADRGAGADGHGDADLQPRCSPTSCCPR